MTGVPILDEVTEALGVGNVVRMIGIGPAAPIGFGLIGSGSAAI